MKNYSYEELSRKTYRGYRAAHIGLTALCVAAMFCAFALTDNTLIFVIGIVAAILVYSYGKRYIAGKYRGMLENKCDPHAHIGFFGECERGTESYYGKLVCRMEIAKGLYYSGDAAAALDYMSKAISADSLLPNELVTYYCMLANCYCMLGMEENLHIVARKVRSMDEGSLIRFQGVQAIEEHIKRLLAFMHRDADTLLRHISERHSYAGGILSNVSEAYMSACAFIWKGKPEAALPLLSFVTENGNTLYYTAKAKQLLLDITSGGNNDDE